MRDAGAVVKENTMTNVSNHGITLLGAVNQTSVEGNTLAGDGSTAIWTERSAGARVGENTFLPGCLPSPLNGRSSPSSSRSPLSGSFWGRCCW